MKVVVVNTLYYPDFQGGAEKSVQLLCEGLVNRGVEVMVTSNSPLSSQGMVNGVKVNYLKTRNVVSFLTVRKYPALVRMIWHLIDSFNPFYFSYYRRLLRSFRPDFVMTHNLSGFSATIWIVAKLLKIPVVHVLRDHALLCPKSTMYAKGKRCARQCFTCRVFTIPGKYLSRNVESVVGISEYILNRHTENGYFRNARFKLVIPNSVAPLKTSSPKSSISNMVVIGYLGRLSYDKGIEFLIKEYLRLPTDIKCKLLIGGVGEEEYVKSLKQLCSGKDIQFLGHVHPDEFYQRIDYLVVPSLLEESFGRVVIEAWQHGVYVIASKSGGMTELVIHGNLSLFDASEEDSLNTLLLLCTKRHFDFNWNTYNNSKHLFEQQRVTDKYLKLLNSIKSGV